MTPPFKMKGYTYPGKSPIKQNSKNEIKLDTKTSSYDYTPSDKQPTPTQAEAYPNQKPYVEPKSTVKVRDYKKEKAISDKEKADRKAARGEFWRDLAGEAGKALIIAGIQTGAAALSQGKTKPRRQGPDASGFSGIQFGRK